MEKHSEQNELANDAQLTAQMVKAWAKSNSIKSVIGAIEDNGPYLVVSLADDELLEDRLQEVVDFKPSAVVIQETKLSQEDISNQLEQLADLDDEGVAERSEALIELKKYVGEVAAIAIRIIVSSPPMILAIDKESPWWDLVFEDFGGELVEGNKCDWEDPKTSDRIGVLARKVAMDPRFKKAKKKAEREHLARSLLSKDEIGHDLYHIVQRASAIFTMEIERDD